MPFEYEITPRPVDLGGGWRLRLLEDGVEVGGGVFPPDGEGEDANQDAFYDAEDMAYDWLDSQRA
jgi:hypothetical protein